MIEFALGRYPSVRFGPATYDVSTSQNMHKKSLVLDCCTCSLERA